MITQLKRAYEPAKDSDGFRILVDRLWPRGISKETAKLDFWAKDLSPSNNLRKWYSHDSDEWPEFKRRYYAELDSKGDEVQALITMIEGRKVTLVYSSMTRLNNALAFKEYLESRSPAQS